MLISKKFGLTNTLPSLEKYWKMLYRLNGGLWHAEISRFDWYVQFLTQPITEKLFLGEKRRCTCKGGKTRPFTDQNIKLDCASCQGSGKINTLPLLKGWEKVNAKYEETNRFILDNEKGHVCYFDKTDEWWYDGYGFAPIKTLNDLIRAFEIEGLELEFNDIEI